MAELGNLNKVYIKTTVGSTETYTLLAGESTNSVSLNANPVEVSDKSSAWQQYLAGLRGGTADVTVYADNSNAEQKSALNSFAAGTAIDVFIGQLGSSPAAPTKGIAFSAIIASISDTNDNGSASSRAMSLQITGQPTFYPTA